MHREDIIRVMINFSTRREAEEENACGVVLWKCWTRVLPASTPSGLAILLAPYVSSFPIVRIIPVQGSAGKISSLFPIQTKPILVCVCVCVCVLL